MTRTARTHRFDLDTALRPGPDGRWSAEVGDGWASLGGRPNGGYLLALALRAAGAAVPGSTPVTATAHYLRPAEPGPVELDVDVVDRGRTRTVAQVRLVQHGSERVRVLAALGAAGPPGGAGEFAPPAPALPAPERCGRPAPGGPAGATIAERFDHRVSPASRWAGAPAPDGAGTGPAVLEGWIRFRDGREPDAAALPLVVDAFPPAVLEVLPVAATPTLELTVHLRGTPAPGWLQARLVSRALLGGLVEEDVELWDATGRLVAMSRQLAPVRTPAR